MPRPHLCRRIGFPPGCRSFAPTGAPKEENGTVSLRLDELEAMRLADLEGLYQEQAAEKLRVSRQTLGNILESARRKVADALVNGKSISIEGGACHRSAEETRRCPHCRKRRNIKKNQGEKR